MLRLFCLVVTLFAGSAGVFAQVAPGAPSLAAQPVQPATNPQDSTPPPGAPDVVPNMQFPNSDVQDVLRFYEQLTGKKLIMDNFVQGKVSIFISKPVPREEAIRIIEMNLLMNGFALVPAGGDLVKVIGTGKNPRTAGVPIISDESEIPPGDRVVSYLFKLRYADATELQQVLNQYLQPVQPYTSILALPKASSVIVTENSSVIRSLANIVNQIDVPPAEVVSEFIKLERADVTKVVEMLKDIFEKGSQSPTGQPSGPGGVRPVRAAQPQQIVGEGDLSSLTALSEEAVVVGKIKITPDVRTNRIHVVTRPINMPFIRKLIGEFDANVEFAKPITRPLKYVSAGEVLPVIVQTLTEPGSDSRGAEAGGTAPGGQQQQQNRQNRNGTGTGTNSTGSLSSSGDSGSLNVSEELSTEAVDTTPKAVTIGNAKIIADQRSNSIIMLGNKEIVQKVEKLLDEMDVKAPQVALSTVIGELTLNSDEEFGVDYFQRLKRTGRDTGAAFSSRNTGAAIANPATLDSITAIQTLAGAASGGGTNVYIAAGNTLSAIVHLLHSTGNFKVLSRPTVFTSNNKKAIIASGTEIPVPVNSVTAPFSGTTPVTGATPSLGSFATSSNIQFKKVALQLEVVPLINSEKEVSLDILQKLDSLAGTTRIDNNDIPNIATRYVRTNVLAPNGATIILGGLITDNKQRNTSGIPVLDRIPLIGSLFRSTTKTKRREELIILMRPEVTLSSLDMYRLRVKNEQKTHFGPGLNEDESITPEAGGKEEMPAPDLPPEK